MERRIKVTQDKATIRKHTQSPKHDTATHKGLTRAVLLTSEAGTGWNAVNYKLLEWSFSVAYTFSCRPQTKLSTVVPPAIPDPSTPNSLPLAASPAQPRAHGTSRGDVESAGRVLGHHHLMGVLCVDVSQGRELWGANPREREHTDAPATASCLPH